MACATIPAGAGGVVWSPSGEPPRETLSEGQHYIGPFATVQVYDLRSQERNEDLVGLTADGAPVEAGASVVTFHLVPGELPQLDRQVGPDYYPIVVAPLVKAQARRVLAHFRSSELLDSAKVRAAQQMLYDQLEPALRTMHIELDGVVFRRVIPASSGAYRAVLDTAAAEQAAQTARADIEAADQRADQRRVKALGVANGLDVVAPTLTPQSLDEARVRAWQRLLTSPSTSVLARPNGETPLLLEVPP
ncbi:MAG TPA: SPFH domain-containing protein [Myxococcales bacterium]|nr:SPFH domain-containing protein [Myxococcales bacterium]